ncbi:exported hypothetical protein [Cupriavidus taiwanensis]|nr:exported hypothetical protein [Cupriavidus taiwanensis]SOY54909.1 exported hypothetical protein [Cupriavidus taiwanensis]SOY88000.1 exported hypothetical protein [Cupriavidus taiwanensis]SOZ61272.1 exported hypothetical protein [Cupriavidus taiwanensis]SOZ81359.1 exported hypothetical protein [Cupriavidus taiwanensis]
MAMAAMAVSSAPAASPCRQVRAAAAQSRREAGMADVGAAEAARQALARRFRDNTGFRAPATRARARRSRPVLPPRFAHAPRAAPAEPCCRAPLVPEMLRRAARAGPVRLFAAL